MCILCVIQKWSRKIATMLPWLVIPLIGLWALSQLLPPAFRFEITSSRLACVLVLLVTLFWYEVLMPQLSAWQIRRDARLRERKRSQAIELQKLRKTATRRCRNCYTAYRDQNPGGGKFMCSYCGHVSKRPVLDLPVLPGMNNSGILKDLVSKGGKILNGKSWSDNGWTCGQDLLENGSWSSGSFAGKSSSYWQKNGGDLFGGEDDEHCLTERSYSRILVFACKALARVFFWRKLFRVSSSGEDASADAERRGMLDHCGDNGVNGQESRGERARRKAEEKRLARLEKELLEEEERKQREEVARLVEERRRLRDEEMEAEKEHGKGVSCKARDGKKEPEKKRREKKKEKDRGSSKSNSDVEEVEKRTTKESERNKSESDRQDQPRTAGESLKSHGAEVGSVHKVAATSNHNRGNAGARYFDRMRGTFLSSSRAFTGGGFFGKSANAATISREHKPNAFVEPAPSTFGKDFRSTTNGDSRTASHPVFVDAQQSVAPKKSWQQLFSRSSSTTPPPLSSNVISRPTVQNPSISENPTSAQSFDKPTSVQSFDNPINFGLSSPFSLPSFSFGSNVNGTALPLSSDPIHSKAKDLPHQLFPEESEIFEDPCYDPDPMSLLGPVSESLDEFQRDLGYVAKTKPSEVTKPSPIEAPFSRSRISEERHASSFPFPGSTSAQDNPNNISETGTWQMWNTTPLVQDGLGLIGGPSSWLLHTEKNSNIGDINSSVPQRTMASLFKNDEQVISGIQHPRNVPLGSFQNGGNTFNGPAQTIMRDPWLPGTLFGPNLIHENQVLLKSKEEGVQNGMIYGNPSDSAASTRDRNDWPMQGVREANKPPARSFYSTTDVQSLWSRN